jgi:hypothetical protein
MKKSKHHPLVMKKHVIKYQPDCSHLLSDAVDCINMFNESHLIKTKIGILNGVLWVMKSSQNKREFQIYVYHTKTQVVCDISHWPIIGSEPKEM